MKVNPKRKFYKKTIKIKDLQLEDRPRQRLISKGVDTLSNAELLAILLWRVPKDSVLNKVNEIFKNYNLKTLSRASLGELKELLGDEVKACQVTASFELARRLASYTDEEKPLIRGAEDIFTILGPEMQTLNQECMKVVLLDSRNRMIKTETVSLGSLDKIMTYPREVFKSAIHNNAASVILVHNHPSGDPEPSKEDISITRALVKSGQILGIEVRDHVIIGSTGFTSLKEIDK